MSTVMLIFWLLGTVFSPCILGDLQFTLLHENDLHSHISPSTKFGSFCESEDYNSCYGGFPRLVSKINELRSSNPNTIHINAGDMYQGTFWYTLFKWQPLGFLTPLLNLDAMALGNHDFDDGISGLVPYLNDISVPVLACNIDLTQEPTLRDRVQPSLTLIVDGIKIGIIGYVTPDTEFLAFPGKTVFLEEEPALQDEIDRLKGQGVNIFIGLGHSGYGRDIEIATTVPDLDLVVGGHSHSYLYAEGTGEATDEPAGPYPTVVHHGDGTKTLVVQAKSYSKYLGQLDLTFSDAGEVLSWDGRPIILDSSVPDDPAARAYLDSLLPQLEEKHELVVGSTAVDLNGDRSLCRTAECNMGNLIADSMLRKLILPGESQWSSITGVILNSGGVRNSIRRGNITFGDVKSVLPFNNDIVYATIPGETLKWVFEHSVAALEPANKNDDLGGGFLQIAGIKVSYDLCMEPGKRVTELQILCNECMMPEYEVVKPDKLYTIGLIEFLYHGGDGYDRIQPETVYYQSLGALDVDVLIQHLSRESPTIASTEGRITFVRDGINCEPPITPTTTSPPSPKRGIKISQRNF